MLRAIAASGAPAPAVLAVSDEALVIELIPTGGSLSRAWASLGLVLARLHATSGARHGWPTDYAFGHVVRCRKAPTYPGERGVGYGRTPGASSRKRWNLPWRGHTAQIGWAPLRGPLGRSRSSCRFACDLRHLSRSLLGTRRSVRRKDPRCKPAPAGEQLRTCCHDAVAPAD